MTNHDESTQEETVADTPEPTRARVVLDTVFVGLMAGTLFWLVVGELEDPTTWGRVGVVAYALLTGFYLWGLIKLVRRRGAPPVHG